MRAQIRRGGCARFGSTADTTIATFKPWKGHDYTTVQHLRLSTVVGRSTRHMQLARPPQRYVQASPIVARQREKGHEERRMERPLNRGHSENTLSSRQTCPMVHGEVPSSLPYRHDLQPTFVYKQAVRSSDLGHQRWSVNLLHIASRSRHRLLRLCSLQQRLLCVCVSACSV